MVLLWTVLLVFSSGSNRAQSPRKAVLLIHGGAGTIKKEYMTPDKENAYRETLKQALEAGYQTLQAGKSSLDAVQAAIHVMEDSPLFNAGKGAVFTHDGTNRMDAAIMNGADLKAGAVAGVSVVKNPIDAARQVMDQSPHVMLSGTGADAFAKKVGCTIVPPSYFYTQQRWEQLQRVLQKGKKGEVSYQPMHSPIYGTGVQDAKFGTVGCIALDHKGDLAAGTSTGGMTGKRYDRIGDSPIIGAGTYANNATCAISCTGWGEYFIRTAAAKTVSDLMEYKGMDVHEAADTVIHHIIADLGGDGGMIALDTAGYFAFPFNTAGMFRGYVTTEGKIYIRIYNNE